MIIKVVSPDSIYKSKIKQRLKSFKGGSILAGKPAPSLRARLAQDGPVLLAGAHDGLSARLIQDAGFDGIWASGFGISAAKGTPDANVLTMTEVLDTAAQMAKATDLPIIADCDNGFGNVLNVIRTVEEFERAGIAGICIEDNLFPKRCSLYDGIERKLASPAEHAGKIRAAVETRHSDDFLIIARTEAFIAGLGLEEALKRIHAYADAGADMLLIHSKAKDASELEAFSKAWDRDIPLVSVPTIYKSSDAQSLYKLGYKMVIFANQPLRGAIKAMKNVLETLYKSQRNDSVDDQIVPLQEVYRLVGLDAIKEQERKYLPKDV
jgi:phosphoenolpyruvate phosphomutase